MSTIHPPDSGVHQLPPITPHISPERVTGASLPLPLTTFIGREREIAEIGRLLCRDDVRLLSLIGPGGVGKTRLALKVTHEVTGSFADGVTFVPLAALRDPALVLPAVAQVVGARANGGRPTIESLVAFLQWKKLLLVLDNVEHVLDTGPKVAEFLMACSGLTVLVTSREPLHVSGEHIVRVKPLALPNPSFMPPFEQLTRYEGIALFVERARATEAGFGLTEANAATVAAMAREHRRQEGFGDDDQCQICGEEDVRALHRVGLIDSTGIPITVTLCAGCHVQLRGKRLTEDHHPAGRANDPFTISIPATEHAILTDWQYDWPRDTWRNQDGSPLLLAAASLRGWLDILRLLIERTVGWIPAFLEHLDADLRQQLGDGWWTAHALNGAPR